MYFGSNDSKEIKDKKRDIVNEYGPKIEGNKIKFNSWKEEVKKKKLEKFNQIVKDINSGVLNLNKEDGFFKNSIEFIPKMEILYKDKIGMNEMISKCKNAKQMVNLKPLIQMQNTSKNFYLVELKELRKLYEEQSKNELGDNAEIKKALMEGFNLKNEEIEEIEKDSAAKISRIK